MKRRHYLSEDELFRFANSHLREAFPNPQRVDCPPDEELQRAVKAPAQGADVIEHVSTCSPCYIRYAELLDEQRRELPAGVGARLSNSWFGSRRRIAWAGAAAVVLIAIAALVISRSHPTPQVPLAFAIDLSGASTSRGAEQEQPRKEIRIPQNLLDLSLQLPVGSDEGRYEIALHSGPSVVWSQVLKAALKDHVVRLKVQVDFRSVATGHYELTVESASGLRFVQPIEVIRSTKTGANQSRWRERLLVATASRLLSIRLPGTSRRTLRASELNSGDPAQLISEADRLAWFGNWPAAAPLYAKAEFLATRNGHSKALVHARIGRIRSEAEGMPFAHVSEMLAKELENPIVQNDPRLRLFALSSKGYTDLDVNLGSCRAAWEQALQTARELHDLQWESRATGELGIVAFLEGNRNKAEKLVGSALLSAMKTGDVAAQVRLFSMIGNGLADMKRYDEGAEFFSRALKLAGETKDVGFPFMAYEGEARCLTALGRPDEAQKLLQTALDQAKRDDKRGHQAQILILLGGMALSNNKTDEAEKYLREAGDLGHLSQFRRMENEAMYELASIYQKQGRVKNTEEALERGITVSRAVGDRYYLPRDLSALAEIKRLKGHDVEADALWDQAADVLDGMLVDAPSWGAKSTMVAASSDIYLRHFALAAKRNDVSKAFEIVERARGRAIADLLWRHPSDRPSETPADRQISSLQIQLIQAESKQTREKLLSALFEAEQRRSFAVNETAKTYPVRRPVLLPILQRSLRGDELLLEYVLSDPNSYCLAITRGSVRLVQLPASRGRIELLVNDFLSRVHDKQPADEPGSQLYSLLLAPVPAAMAKPRIVVVPDGVLNLLPFDALQDGKGKYLLETSVISYVPSATVLRLLISRSTPSPVRFLGIGGVVYQASSSVNTAVLRPAGAATRGVAEIAGANFEPLPASRNEVLAAAEVFGPKSVVLLGANATEVAFKKEPLASFRVLHLAVHGIADSKYPERAALVLGRDPKSDDDGLLQAREIADLPIRADLVTLSACDTGIGKLQGEEGISSLQNAFLMAGARTTLATLWTADDTFTAALIKQFYANLAAGMDKGSALRKAKLQLISKFGYKAQPYYWAAFVLAGDSTSPVPLAR